MPYGVDSGVVAYFVELDRANCALAGMSFALRQQYQNLSECHAQGASDKTIYRQASQLIGNCYAVQHLANELGQLAMSIAKASDKELKR